MTPVARGASAETENTVSTEDEEKEGQGKRYSVIKLFKIRDSFLIKIIMNAPEFYCRIKNKDSSDMVRLLGWD